MQKLFVMKFGGTSVASHSAREAACNSILSAPGMPVVVVSAMGRKGAPYATDSLRDLLLIEGGDLAKRDLDLMMSCGETIAALVMAQTLKAKGRNAKALTGSQAGISTDGKFGDATVTGVDTRALRKLLEDGIVPVVAGFQGDYAGDVTTLGRGGSDITAAILGKALEVDEVQIYTDVQGILTTDPAICNEAALIPFLTYQELLEMAQLGAKVIHPKAVQILSNERIPIRILSPALKGDGTLVSDSFKGNHLSKKQVVTSVTVVEPRSLVSLENEKCASVFATFAEAKISVDLINVSPESISFTIDSHEDDSAKKLLPSAIIKSGFAKVSVVGAGMRGVPGVMARVTMALAKENIEIVRTADSHTSISCLIEERFVKDAVKVLHDAFLLS